MNKLGQHVSSFRTLEGKGLLSYIQTLSINLKFARKNGELHRIRKYASTPFSQKSWTGKEKKRKTTQAVKALPTSTKEKRIPRAKAPCIPSTKRKKNSMGIRR
eukprot:1158236-Pelagomonas_calceolata.AAC.1